MLEFENSIPLKVKQYNPVDFRFGSALSSQGLNDFQQRMQESLSTITKYISGGMDFVVIEPRNTGNQIRSKLDAIFVARTSLTTLNFDDFYSYRHASIGDAQTGISATPKFFRTDDFTLAIGDSVIYGSRFPFSDLLIDFSTVASSSMANTWKFYSTDGWINLSSVAGGAINYLADGTVSWSVPSSKQWSYNLLHSTFPSGDYGSKSVIGIIKTDKLFWVLAEIGSVAAATKPIFNSIDFNTYYLDSLKVLAQNPVSLSVYISPGVGIVNKKAIYLETFLTISFSGDVPGSNSLIAIIYIDDKGNISKSIGASAASPVAPIPPSNAMKLCQITLSSGQTTISQGGITDSRVKFHTP